MRVCTYRDSKRTDSTHAQTRHSTAFSSTRQDHNGGALKLELGAVGVFQGTADFADISIIPADTGIRRFVKGAAIYSKVCYAHNIAANIRWSALIFTDTFFSGVLRKSSRNEARRQVTCRQCCCCPRERESRAVLAPSSG